MDKHTPVFDAIKAPLQFAGKTMQGITDVTLTALGETAKGIGKISKVTDKGLKKAENWAHSL